MALFEIKESDDLVPFRQLRGGADLYEQEIEDLLWSNIEEFTGEALFRLARQPTIRGGGRPDVLALDRHARVVIVEVKRDVDRGQLAQCLEYAGWGRKTNLDELAGFYHRGSDHFFSDWRDFTDTNAPLRVRLSPRLILIAREFHGRTASAFEFLVENGLPVRLVRVALYEVEQKRRFVDVEGERELEFSTEGSLSSPPTATIDPDAEVRDATKIDGKPVRVPDLIEAGLLQVGEPLVWNRPRRGQTYRAFIAEDGSLEFEDGRRYSSPSRAAIEAANIPSYDGWYAWRQEKPGGLLLKELRLQLVDSLIASDPPLPESS